ncbi:hypothetical protein B0H14DRAFT_3867235 [Mycena olivaceomarginata]|nr:hypothetical protein B0H14DRAFT_3867235 [Mycena olivaceomarginata]
MALVNTRKCDIIAEKLGTMDQQHPTGEGCSSLRKSCSFPRPIYDFESLVSESDFTRLLDFVYITSKEDLDAFSAFVYDWWAHKEMHDWIIPRLVKSQSLIPADVWDRTPSTTNMNEAQHHWTNFLTGTKLMPVEALEAVRIVDERVAWEIEMSIQTGIMANLNNEVVHRMARNSQRNSTRARKQRESREAADVSHQLQLQIDAEAEKHGESSALTKALKERLKAVKGTTAAGDGELELNASTGMWAGGKWPKVV